MCKTYITPTGSYFYVDTVRDQDKYTITCNGGFWCTCDNQKEVNEEIELIVNEFDLEVKL